MTTKELIVQVDTILDSRNLARPEMRKRAARQFISFIESTGSFLKDNQVNLPLDKGVFQKAIIQYYGKEPFCLDGGTNILYDAFSSLASKPASRLIETPKPFQKEAVSVVSLPIEVKDVEKTLIMGSFVPLNGVDERSVPKKPGLYCIKLRKDVPLPAKFGSVREDGIIYIGLSSNSLYQRFWKQELNCEGAGTFFRSIGTILGFYPPKGSLYGSRSCNFKFTAPDTEKIKKWMRQSLFVNFVPYRGNNLDTIETKLIQSYRPLVNIKKNPSMSQALYEARQERIRYARNR